MAEEVVENSAENMDELDDEWAQALAEEQAGKNASEAGTAADGETKGETLNEPEIQKAQFAQLEEKSASHYPHQKMEMLLDVVLPVSIELGRSKMFIKEILDLERGSIIELDKMAGEPVDLYINNKKMAEGEVVVVDKHFGIRITNLIDPADRIKNLGTMS